MTTVDDLIRTYNEDDSSLSSEDIEDDDCVKGGEEEEEEEEVKDIDALVQPRNPPTGTSIDNEDTEDDTVVEDKSKTKSVSPDTPAPSVTDNEEEVILTQRDWQRKFVKKIRFTNDVKFATVSSVTSSRGRRFRKPVNLCFTCAKEWKTGRDHLTFCVEANSFLLMRHHTWS